MSVDRNNEAESFRAWAPDFDRWPKSWMGVAEDLAYGKKLLPWFAGFLQALYAEGMARKTYVQYRDTLWLLGGTIIREISLYEAYQADPLEKLRESVADDGILPDHYDQMTQAELRAFERMCRRFEKHLEKLR
ncbi:hypothetical protein C2E25_08575 [Geothermobacter hydrogeniphilus]|uniref:Uncharacterized protein n=1 Tax=Geothermobacter hydrogeniphilus TaxID=1969733 RepID=A0A2K2HAG6_9BACT|nr:hypothetical protein [Geothermobacter hydrogeniphilus]PNU20230.1 hypothetical protein C2E25_08575 [Geothermobacter hydrogeniphilus]